MNLKYIHLIFAFLILCGCSDNQDEVPDLDNELIKIELGNTQMDIPLRYAYGIGLEKWKGWRKPREGVSKVDVISISMLLPDLRPYYEEDNDRWKVVGHGDRIQVSLGINKHPNWFQNLTDRLFEYSSKGKFYEREKNIYGLYKFSKKTSDRYFPLELSELSITCDKKDRVKYPSCKTKSTYRDGLSLEYYFSSSYLPKWQLIDKELKEVLDGFTKKHL